MVIAGISELVQYFGPRDADFYDLVITDLKMPEVDGMKVLKHVVEQSPDTMCIILTGYGTIESAVEAIKAAGLEPGDIMIVSVDGTRGGFQLMIDGWVQADVECNPLLGPQVMEMALALANGEPVERETLTNETVYYPEEAAELLPSRLY